MVCRNPAFQNDLHIEPQRNHESIVGHATTHCVAVPQHLNPFSFALARFPDACVLQMSDDTDGHDDASGFSAWGQVLSHPLESSESAEEAARDGFNSWGQVLQDSLAAADSSAEVQVSSLEGWGAALSDTLRGFVVSQYTDAGVVPVSTTATADSVVTADADDASKPSLAVPAKPRPGRPPGSTGSRLLREDMKAYWSAREEEAGSAGPPESENLQLQSWISDPAEIAESRAQSQKRAKGDAVTQAAKPFGLQQTFLGTGTSNQKLMSNCFCDILAKSQPRRHTVGCRFK